MTWEYITLDKVLRLTKNRIEIVGNKHYRVIQVSVYPQGLFSKGQYRGNDLRGNSYQIVHSGQFVMTRIHTQQRRWGLVPPELDGCIIHRSFACFDVAPPVDLSYFETYLYSRHFNQAVQESLNRHEKLDLRRLVRKRVPVPTLEAQQQIARLWKHLGSITAQTSEMISAITALNKTLGADLFQGVSTTSTLAEHATIGHDQTVSYPVYFLKSGEIVHHGTRKSDFKVGILPDHTLDAHYLYHLLAENQPIWTSLVHHSPDQLETRLKALPIPVLPPHEQRQRAHLMQEIKDAYYKLQIEYEALEQLRYAIINGIVTKTLPMPLLTSLAQTL